ncbi:MAG: riboflavin synthase [Solirubrobacteraceae bacterium]
MFTGLVSDLGTVLSISRDQGMAHGRLRIGTPLAENLTAGDSIAVNGVCLTAIEPSTADFEADVVAETLQRSSLAALESGSRVNLELPLRAADRLGGHIVQGHVDGVASVEQLDAAGQLRLTLDSGLLRFVVEKGSIALDGVSLTVAAVDERSLTVCLIPETLRTTTLGDAVQGAPVNVEVDIMAKHLEKLVATSGAGA